MSPAPFVAVYLVAVALLVGSFINLAADRLPRGESLIHPRSHCRSCDRVLSFVDLVPVGGYLLRRGRCAGCGAEIGVSSPMVEAACGLGMAASLAIFGGVPGAVIGLATVGLIGVTTVAAAVIRPRARAR